MLQYVILLEDVKEYNMKLYHGSFDGKIDKLLPLSKCNDDEKIKVVYLTESREYALFYIWDAKHNDREKKWVTCCIKDGIVYYEEQFSNQLYKFYNGVSGYIYYCENINAVEASEPSMWYTTSEVKNLSVQKVENVYEEIIRAEKEGKVVVYRYDELSLQKKIEINEKTSSYILIKDLLNSESDDAIFMKKNHVDAWRIAQEKYKFKRD